MERFWKCGLCTFANKEEVSLCGLCETPRDAVSTLAADVPISFELLTDEESVATERSDTGMIPHNDGAHVRRAMADQSLMKDSIDTFGGTDSDEGDDAPALAKALSKAHSISETDAKKAAKAAKKAAKELEKQQKQTARIADRAARGGYALTEIGLCLDVKLHCSLLGKKVTVSLSSEYAILPPMTHEVAHSILWKRRRIDSRSKGGVIEGSETTEPFIGIVWEGSTYVNLLRDYGTAGIQQYIAAVRRVIPPGTRILLITHGAVAYVTEQLKQADANRRKGVVAPPVITRDGLEAANSHIYVNENIQITDAASTEDFIEHLRHVTRAIAEMPYRMQPSALAAVTKVRATRVSGAVDAGDDEGEGKTRKPKNHVDTWFAQLQMIPGVSEKKAAAVVAKFPSMRKLVDVYRDPAIPLKTKETILEDVMMDTTGRKMTKLSRDIYRLFTSMDPDEIIGAE